MATDILRPNATVSNAWSIGNHASVDENVTQPDVPGGTDYLTATNNNSDDNDVIVMGFPNTITGVGEITNITVWNWGFKVGSNFPEVDINMGGWQGYQECGQFNWTSDSFNGNWNQGDLDGLQVRFRADVPVKNDTNNFNVVYVVVTYMIGYAHSFLGVPAVNIGNVNGIPTANIASIKGV
ncbi:hypothetical protein LCGC14_1204470 [marine sediment metagenome]|uniref:Uncharacterized protein n=1 Tax=marine sediment metagenome TaxID=412755 RepID=A0A0F9LFZ6_9ZZZZ